MDSPLMPLIWTVLQTLETWINITHPDIKLECRIKGQFNLPIIPLEIQVSSQTTVLFSYLTAFEKKALSTQHTLLEEVHSKLTPFILQLAKDLQHGSK